jgi:hypothetical protein
VLKPFVQDFVEIDVRQKGRDHVPASGYDSQLPRVAISGLNSKTYRLPVYASRPGLLQSAQHSVPAVSTLGRTGLGTRRVPKKVSAFHTFSFSKLGLAHQEPASRRIHLKHKKFGKWKKQNPVDRRVGENLQS